MNQLQELFNVLTLLFAKLEILFEKISVLLWGIFSSVFIVVLRFTIDLIRLILKYL